MLVSPCWLHWVIKGGKLELPDLITQLEKQKSNSFKKINKYQLSILMGLMWYSNICIQYALIKYNFLFATPKPLTSISHSAFTVKFLGVMYRRKYNFLSLCVAYHYVFQFYTCCQKQLDYHRYSGQNAMGCQVKRSIRFILVERR